MSNPAPLTPQERDFWLKLRQGLLIQLAAIEERLGLPRTYVPKDRGHR